MQVGGKVSIETWMFSIRLDIFLMKLVILYQQRHLKENNYASTNEQPGNDPS